MNDNETAKIELSDLDDFFRKIAAEKLAMQWRIVTDEYGADFCLVHKKTNTAIFPFPSVCKRIESREYDFLRKYLKSQRAGLKGNEKNYLAAVVFYAGFVRVKQR